MDDPYLHIRTSRLGMITSMRLDDMKGIRSVKSALSNLHSEFNYFMTEVPII